MSVEKRHEELRRQRTVGVGGGIAFADVRRGGCGYRRPRGCFRAVIAAGYAHVVKSTGGRTATEAGSMRWLNTILSNVKRSLDGTYHTFEFPAYIHRYLAEAAWRFNRRFDRKILVPRLLVALARCETLTRAAFAVRYTVPAGLTLMLIR